MCIPITSGENTQYHSERGEGPVSRTDAKEIGEKFINPNAMSASQSFRGERAHTTTVRGRRRDLTAQAPRNMYVRKRDTYCVSFPAAARPIRCDQTALITLSGARSIESDGFGVVRNFDKPEKEGACASEL